MSDDEIIVDKLGTETFTVSHVFLVSCAVPIHIGDVFINNELKSTHVLAFLNEIIFAEYAV